MNKVIEGIGMENVERKRRLHLSKDDLSEAKEFVDYILEQQSANKLNRTELKALTTALVVAYSRPFKKNKSDSRFPADPILSNDFLANFSDKENNLHKKVLSLRDREFAHTDAEPKQLKMREDVFGGLRSVGWVETATRCSFFEDELCQLQSMLTKLINKIEEEFWK